MGKTRRTGDLVTDNNLYVNPTDDSFHVGTGITMYGGSVGIISCTGIYLDGSALSAGGGAIGIQSGGTSITSAASTINFVGTGITMSDDGSITDITFPSITRTTTRVVASPSQTAFTVAEYDTTLIDVYLNGVKLDSTEYATTNSTTITLTTGASHGDIFESVSYSNFAGTTLRNLPQNAQTSAYTLVASDTGKHISITTGGVTIASGVFSVGDIVTIYNNSGSTQTITQGASVTLRQAGTSNTGNRSLGQYGTSTLLCVGSDVFVISGSGLS